MRATGYALDEVRGKDWFELFVPEDQREARRREEPDLKGLSEQSISVIPNWALKAGALPQSQGRSFRDEHGLGEHREEHEPARDDRLHDRERRHGHRGHVQGPGADGDQHAQREPLRAEQRGAAAERVLPVDVGCCARAPVLVEEPEVRRERAGEREQDAELKRHRWCRWRIGVGPEAPRPT